MKSFIVFALVAAVAVALPVDPKEAVIVKYDNDNIGIGDFHYAFETSDGKVDEAVGILKNVGTENEGTEVRGSYQYTGDDGVIYSVTYIANENGFQPSGAHLPRV